MMSSSSAAAAKKAKKGPEMAVNDEDDTSSLLRGQTHSRESSGASNLSVKFTITQSSDGGSPVASATVSPAHPAPASTPAAVNRDDELPPVAVRRNEVKFRRKKRPGRRRSTSPEMDVDSLSPDEKDPENGGNLINEAYGKSCECLDKERMGDSKSQNSDYGSFCNTPSCEAYLTGSKSDSSSSDKKRSAGERVSSSGSAPAGQQEQSVISTEAYQTQPLLDHSASDSSCSDDDAGANSSGYTRRKTRHHHGASSSVTRDIRIEVGSDMGEEGLHFPGEPFKTFLAFVFLFFAWVATTTSLAITHDRVPQVAPLPDVFLDNTTFQPWGLSVSEYIIMISTLSAFLVTVFHKHRSIVLRRIFLLVGLHYYYRAVTMFITVLPVANADYKCAPQLNSTEVTPLIIAQRVLKLLSGFGLSINGKHIYCGDYIYSGHTMTLIMTYLVIRGYSPKKWFLFHYASLCLTICGILFLLLARGHYSIDVVIAYWITTRMWWIFHTMTNNTNLKETKNGNNFLRKMWWWHLFLYFEVNIPRSVPREYNLPIPARILRLKPFLWIKSRFSSSGDSSNSHSSDVESGQN